jgi:hypothetical protein
MVGAARKAFSAEGVVELQSLACLLWCGDVSSVGADPLGFGGGS